MVSLIKLVVSAIIATFLLMHPLDLYYRQQADGGGSENGVGPIYSTTPYLQRGPGMEDFLEAYSAGFDP